jgi:16S rRNA (guanine966-N2)-methyltransferase
VDRSAEVATSLREQLTLLGEPQIQAVQADVQQWLRANAAGPGQPPPFDIVFLDPPFHSQLLPDDVQLLEDKGWLSPEAWIYIEAQKGLNLELPANWSVHRSKQAGQVSYQLIKRT